MIYFCIISIAHDLQLGNIASFSIKPLYRPVLTFQFRLDWSEAAHLSQSFICLKNLGYNQIVTFGYLYNFI